LIIGFKTKVKKYTNILIIHFRVIKWEKAY